MNCSKCGRPMNTAHACIHCDNQRSYQTGAAPMYVVPDAEQRQTLALESIAESLRNIEAKMPERWELAVEPSLYNKGVDALVGLGIRARKALKYAGIKTVGELCQKNEADLRCLKNFGQVSFNEVIRSLDRIGLRLGIIAACKESEPTKGDAT